MYAVFLSVTFNCDEEQKIGKSDTLNILTTTTISADVVENVCGDHAEVQSLLPQGASPHGFEPAPRDVAKIERADILFISGGGLEQFLDNLINTPDINNKTISLSKNVKFLHSNEPEHTEEHNYKQIDPHVWMNPLNTIIWVNTIEEYLCETDSNNCEFYKKNAEAYRTKLIELDVWIADQFKSIDENNRKIVTDHRMLEYFTHRYGLEQVGTIIPGFSALAEPSAREIAQLQDAIKAQNIRAVLIGFSINPTLAERITNDTGTNLIRFYGGSLSEKGGPADTYLKYMHFNTQAILQALN